MVLTNHLSFLFEINMVINNHPSIARAAAALLNLPCKDNLFYGASS